MTTIRHTRTGTLHTFLLRLSKNSLSDIGDLRIRKGGAAELGAPMRPLRTILASLPLFVIAALDDVPSLVSVDSIHPVRGPATLLFTPMR
ncbi:unnamed protein product [Peniophora sp. CBMAI 1063]|nr:unnamed protein product [Peniophora sp. CBMAI 1063]